MNIEQAIDATNDLMYSVVESDVAVLQEASRHIIAAGGKRVRPRLLFLAYEVAGGRELERAVPLAAAIELVHTATLVHDDINDHGKTRRGRATINEKWGRTFALLTGDFLFTKVYELMAPYRDLNMIFAQATVALVEGETLQADAAKNDNLTREIYQQIVAKKTASLFRAAAMLGSQLGGADQDDTDALGEFGFYLGLAFQIVDDLLDLVGDPRLLGKTANLDLVQGKGLATAVVHGENGRHLTSAATLEADEPEETDPILDIKRRLIAGGAVEEGRQMAQLIGLQAETTLARFEPSPSLDELRDLIRLVIDRDH